MSDTLLETPPGRGRRRKEDLALDEAVSQLDIHTDISSRESLAIILRSAGYVRFFFWRFVAKLAMTWVARAVPLLILPWPAKMLIDHVVLSRPIGGRSSSRWLACPP